MVFKIRSLVEVAGFPQNHVNEVMLKVIDNIKKEPKIKVTKEQISEAQAVKEIFSGFMELEIEIETFEKLIFFCQTYLPSSIEILDTKDIKLDSEDFRSGINDLLAYLHRINLVVSNMQSQLGQK